METPPPPGDTVLVLPGTHRIRRSDMMCPTRGQLGDRVSHAEGVMQEWGLVRGPEGATGHSLGAHGPRQEVGQQSGPTDRTHATLPRAHMQGLFSFIPLLSALQQSSHSKKVERQCAREQITAPLLHTQLNATGLALRGRGERLRGGKVSEVKR